MGAVLRDARPKSATPLVIGGHANVYAATAKDGAKHLPLDSGINPIAAVKGSEGPRVPAIIIASSPHKVGRVETPWQDTFDPDRGFVRFFGDNKTPGADPATSPGNRVLLEQLALHAAPTEATRRRAAPIIFFERVAVDGKRKGFPRFQGFGLLRGAEVVVSSTRMETPSQTTPLSSLCSPSRPSTKSSIGAGSTHAATQVQISSQRRVSCGPLCVGSGKRGVPSLLPTMKSRCRRCGTP
jgi:hypothetical protein